MNEKIVAMLMNQLLEFKQEITEIRKDVEHNEKGDNQFSNRLEVVEKKMAIFEKEITIVKTKLEINTDGKGNPITVNIDTSTKIDSIGGDADINQTSNKNVRK